LWSYGVAFLVEIIEKSEASFRGTVANLTNDSLHKGGVRNDKGFGVLAAENEPSKLAKWKSSEFGRVRQLRLISLRLIEVRLGHCLIKVLHLD
jgi:hypothetical protein